MNRDDLISKRARTYAYAELEKIGSNQTIWFTAPLFDSEDLSRAYMQGAKDAEDNPAWRMCCAELPPLEKESERYSQDVIIAVQIDNEYEYGFSYYDYHNEYWVGSMPETFIPNVIAWLPLPKFNSEIKNFYDGKQ